MAEDIATEVVTNARVAKGIVSVAVEHKMFFSGTKIGKIKEDVAKTESIFATSRLVFHSQRNDERATRINS